MALADFSSISGHAPPVTAETERRVGVRVRRSVQGNFCSHAKAAPLERRTRGRAACVSNETRGPGGEIAQ
jgi:hypothetical protein